VPAPLALSLTLALAVTAACADEADPDDPTGGDGAAGTGSVAAGLAALPPAAEGQVVVWGDLARAAELAGLERPAADDTGTVPDYVLTLSGQRVDPPAGGGSRVAAPLPEVAQARMSAQSDEIVAEVGWGLAQVDTFVERQTPPDSVALLGGAFDDGALEEALGEPDGDTWVLGDPGGDLDLGSVTPARPIGETLFLARTGDGGLVVSTHTDATGPVLAAVAGEGDEPTLADEAPLAAAAAALDAEEAYGALLVSPGLAGGGLRVTPEASLATTDACLPAAQTATATGITDDDGPVMLAVLVHDSADAAAANAEALERLAVEGATLQSGRPWSEYVSVEGVEVTGDSDEVVVGRLRIADEAPATTWQNVVWTRDGLVSSC
jgi:hypothetical protein